MKKNNLLVIALIVILSSITATSYSQVRFGIRGEAGLNKVDFKESDLKGDNLNTFKLGPTIEIKLPIIDLGIEAGVLYNNNKMDVEYISNSNKEPERVKVTNHYIDIPVNLKYKFGLILPVKIYTAAGPYARIHVGGDDLTFNQVKEEVKAKSFEAGLNLGLGVELFRKIALGVNYGIQLTDNYSVSKPEWDDAFNNKKSTWSVQATFYL